MLTTDRAAREKLYSDITEVANGFSKNYEDYKLTKLSDFEKKRIY